MNKKNQKIVSKINDTKGNIEELIRENFDSLSKGEKKVATYILDNYVNALLLSSSELARAVGVGDTMVIRFAKDLGFKGFAEFKKQMKANINVANTPYDYLKAMESEQQESQREVKYLNTLLEDIHNFARFVDYDALDQAAELILQARMIYVIGLGSDAIMTKFLAIYFEKMGLNVKCITEGSVTLWDGLLKISSDDVILTSSFPRYLKEEQLVGELAKEKKIPLITITSSDASSILWKSDVNLSAKESQQMFFNSMTISSIICNLLLLKIYDKAPELISKNIEHYHNFVKSEWI